MAFLQIKFKLLLKKNMKRIIYLLLITLVALSCTGVKNKEANTITLDSIVVQEKIKLLPDKPDSVPYATLNIKFVYPTAFGSKAQLQKLQSIFHENVLGEQYANAPTPDNAINTYAKDYTKMYREATPDFIEASRENSEEAYSLYGFLYSRSLANKIEYKNENILSISTCNDDYLGGAHGVYIQKNVVVNLNTTEKIQEADIFISDYKESLALIIREKLLKVMAENAGCDDVDLKDYFFDFDSINPNNNFLMDDKGVHYVYNVYEIASHAAGMFEVFIPYSEITPLLNPEAFAKFFPDTDLKGDLKKPEGKRANYNDFPIAYVKNSKLYFFNPENETKVEFVEETDSVFNGVYSDKDAMFYYTVSQGGKLKIKQMDLSDKSAQPKWLFDLNKSTSEFFSETYGEKAKLTFIKDNLLLDCDFSWESYSFTKYYNYSMNDHTVAKIDWRQFESRYGSLLSDFENNLENYQSVYNKAKQLNLQKEVYAEDDFEIEYFFESVSADDSKIVFAILLGFGDLPHGPYCVANTDGTNMQVLENTDMGSSFKPLWCNNNLLFIRDVKVDDENYISEFCYTRTADNTVRRIDQGVDYYTVRKKQE